MVCRSDGRQYLPQSDGSFVSSLSAMLGCNDAREVRAFGVDAWPLLFSFTSDKCVDDDIFEQSIC